MAKAKKTSIPQMSVIRKTQSEESQQSIETRGTHPAAIVQKTMLAQSLGPTDIMQLQNSLGNRAVVQLLQTTGLINQPLQKINTLVDDSKPSDVLKTDPFADQEHLEGNQETMQSKKENQTGLPDNLKAGVESLSGFDISSVRVHYNSDKPEQVGALAYTQGSDIHVGPGQERHLPHEAWHLVQQAQGRVHPTVQMKGFSVNDDIALETEADIMGRKLVEQPFHYNDSLCKTGFYANSSLTLQGFFAHQICTKKHVISDEVDDNDQWEKDDDEKCDLCGSALSVIEPDKEDTMYYCADRHCGCYMQGFEREADANKACPDCGKEMLNIEAHPAMREGISEKKLSPQERQLKALIQHTRSFKTAHHPNRRGHHTAAATEKHSSADGATAKQKSSYIEQISALMKGVENRKLIKAAKEEIARLGQL